VITEAVNDYEKYLDKLKDEPSQEFFKRTFDYKLSDTLTQEMVSELNIAKMTT
jgi:type III secretory pathway component EscR